MSRFWKVGLIGMFGVALVVSAAAIQNERYYNNAKAAEEPECVGCTTTSTQRCGDLFNTCGTKDKDECNKGANCNACSGGTSGYAISSGTSDPEEGTEPKEEKYDCGKEKTGGKCDWSWKVCVCGGGTEGEVGDCGERTQYQTCDPTP